MVQGQVRSLLDLFSSEPALQEAIEVIKNDLQAEINDLRHQKQTLDQEIMAWSLQYQATHGGKVPARNEWYV